MLSVKIAFFACAMLLLLDYRHRRWGISHLDGAPYGRDPFAAFRAIQVVKGQANDRWIQIGSLAAGAEFAQPSPRKP